MNENELFQAALGLLPPWLVSRCTFDESAGRLDIHLDFPRGGVFPCPVCAAPCKAYDTDPLTWRHLNFFQHQAFLHARTPRVECARCGIHRVAVPWARPDSGFTLLFEAMVLMLAKSMPVLAVARFVNEHDTLVWRIVTHYVDAARAKADHSSVTQVGLDETAARRGQDYVSLFVDLEQRKVLFATPGKVRRLERLDHPELAGSRYVWLKNPENLTAKQGEKFDTLDVVHSHLKTARAYQIRLAFQDLFNQPAENAKAFLDKWYFWATHCRIPAIIDAAKSIRRHQDGILRWFTSGINNGILEGINSLVQAAKAKARGYRSERNLVTIIYLIAGKLDLACQPT